MGGRWGPRSNRAPPPTSVAAATEPTRTRIIPDRLATSDAANSASPFGWYRVGGDTNMRRATAHRFAIRNGQAPPSVPSPCLLNPHDPDD
jgi:hypothetical protein